MAAPWENDPIVQPVGASGAGGGLRQIVAPQADQPSAQTPEQAEADRLRNEALRLEIQRERDKLAATPEGKPLPAWAAKPFEDQIGIYAGLASAADNFQNEFGGNTVTGGLENTLQGLYGGFGSEGQRDWWAAFRQNDNVIRNQLFGATLTPSEQRAYAATSINERMDPEEIRRNLQSRREIVRKALSRKTAFFRAQGYNDDAISALAGEYAGDFSPESTQAAGGGNDPASGGPPIIGGPPGGNTGPLDPNGEGDIGFASRASAEANSLPPGAQEFQRELSAALDSGKLASAEDIIRFGRVRGFNIPEDQARAAADYVAKGGKGVQVGTPTYETPDISDVRGEGGVEEVVRAALRGIPGAFGLDDELGATAETIFNDGTMRENLARERAVRDYDEDENFWPRLVGSLASAAVLPSSTTNAARGAATQALRSGLGREAAIKAARAAFARQLGIEGGAYGGTFGFFETDGSLGDRALGAAGTAAIAGAGSLAGGYVGGKVLDSITRPSARANNAATAVDEALEYGIDIPLEAAGGRGSKIVANTLSNMPGSATVMNAGRQRTAGQVEGAVDDVASGYGSANSFMAAGEAAQRGARNWISRFERVSGKAYDAIPISNDAQSSLASTRGALQSLTSKFASNPELADALRNPKLDRYMSALGSDTSKLSWQDLKAFRSRIGEEIGDHRFSDGTLKSDLRQLYGALSDDMRATASAQGPSALRAFERANNLYREGQQRIDTALVSILGNDGRKTPEAAARVIQTISKAGKGSSDLGKLAEIRKSMRPEEWGDVSGTLIRLLGQPANSEGRQFSAQTFIRNFDDMTDGAKNLLFGGENKELRQNLDGFSKVVRDLAEVDALRNSSNTAGQILTGLSLFQLGNLPALAGQAVASYGLAKAFTNPKFVQWATGYSKMLKGAAKAWQRPSADNIGKQAELLRKVAVAEPSIGQEALGLRQALLNAANDNVGAAAASGSNEQQGAQ